MHLDGGPRPDAPGTLNQLFFETVAREDRPDALLHRVDGVWQRISHAELKRRARHIALGLRALGVSAGERVGILAENGPAWALCDWATLSSGNTNVPVYPTLPAAQVAYVLRDAAVTAVFASTPAQVAKVAAVRAELPALREVIAFEPAAGADVTLAELEARGAALDDAARAARWEHEALAVRPDDVATLIYTSGTTGEPKGVMLTHDNIASNVRAALATVMRFKSGDELGLSILPLSHSFERMAGHYAMFATGTPIAYARSLDTVGEDMLEVRPTVVVAVPRLFEKIYARVFDSVRRGPAFRRAAFHLGVGVTERWADAVLNGRDPGRLLGAGTEVARRLVFGAVRQRTGGRLRYFISGGAPLAPEIARFFFAVGLAIIEGYGMTESSPVITVNRPDDLRLGSVGKPLPGIEVSVADDGEILTRGPHVMRGYFQRPDATNEAVDRDGWLHTGDVGKLEGGRLFITDRKKDIIVTAGGKNIAPQPIESCIKTSRFVAEAVLLGDRRRYPVLLVVPAFDVLETWARERGIVAADHEALLARPEVRAHIEAQVQERLLGLARYETPKKIGLLARDLTLERGELTPSLKVKRRVVEAHNAALVESLYADAATA
jgi:long-chain acyl-CoA synthetase